LAVNRALLASFSLLIFLSSQNLYAANQEIVIGRSLPLSGHSAEIGKGLQLGANAYFNRVNREGGVTGNKIKVVDYDDAYDPTQTGKNVSKLVAHDKAVVIFDIFGAGAVSAIIPLVAKENVPLFATFTGLESLRNPVTPQIFNTRASFFDEAEALIAQASDKMGIKEIGVFLQSDGYGQNGKAGTARALAARGLKLHGEGSHVRNSDDIAQGLQALLSSRPKAIVMWCLPAVAAKFISQAREHGYSPLFLLSSALVTGEVLDALKPADEAYISLARPLNIEKTYRLVQNFAKDVASDGHPEAAEMGFALQGYLDATILVAGMKASGPSVTRESLIHGLNSLKDLDIGGMQINFSTSSHQATSEIFLRKIAKGHIVPQA
jgi:branched-chain amino acid transport system substrate-binding protein